MPFKDKERQKEYQKCYMKEYQLKNKDKLKEYKKEYHLKNKDKLKKYFEDNIEKESCRRRKQNWKKNGLVDSDNDNYEKIHQRYIDTTNCDLCNVVLTTDNKITSKNMEHDHETGLFRNVVCRKCNLKIRDTESPSRSNTGIKNITYVKRRNHYRYDKTTNRVKVYKAFKELHHTICYSIVHDLITDLS